MKEIELKDIEYGKYELAQIKSKDEFGWLCTYTQIDLVGKLELNVDLEQATFCFTNSLSNYIWDKLKADPNNKELFKLPKEVMGMITGDVEALEEEGRFKEYINPFKEYRYYALVPESVKGLYCIESEEPNHDIEFETIYQEIKDTIVNDIKEMIECEAEAEKAELEREEKKKEIIEKYKLEYALASSEKARIKVASELKNILELDYNEKLSKDKIIYKYFSR